MDPLEQWLRSLGMRLTLAEEKRKERRKSDSQDKERRKSDSHDKEKRNSESQQHTSDSSKANENPAIPLLDTKTEN